MKFLLFLILLGGGVFLVWWLLSRRGEADSSRGTAAVSRELSNDIVTVTKLQVALLAEARDIQSELTDLSHDADLETSEGLTEFLHECALALLRKPEFWTHGRANSQTLKSREEAERVFGELSIEERSKFSAETFSKVGARLRERAVETDDDLEPGEYVVVTLLVGTEDDKPLFDSVNSEDDLKQALTKLAALTTDYVLVFELLWTPQANTDSLTADDLLTEYSDMIPL